MNTPDDLANDILYLEQRHPVPTCPECGSLDVIRYDCEGQRFIPELAQWVTVDGLSSTDVTCRDCDWTGDIDELETIKLSDRNLEDLS